jgi:hypothetical protein
MGKHDTPTRQDFSWQQRRLFEEIRERRVIEQVLRLDDFRLPEARARGDTPGIELRVDW